MSSYKRNNQRNDQRYAYDSESIDNVKHKYKRNKNKIYRHFKKYRIKKSKCYKTSYKFNAEKQPTLQDILDTFKNINKLHVNKRLFSMFINKVFLLFKDGKNTSRISIHDFKDIITSKDTVRKYLQIIMDLGLIKAIEHNKYISYISKNELYFYIIRKVTGQALLLELFKSYKMNAYHTYESFIEYLILCCPRIIAKNLIQTNVVFKRKTVFKIVEGCVDIVEDGIFQYYELSFTCTTKYEKYVYRETLNRRDTTIMDRYYKLLPLP